MIRHPRLSLRGLTLLIATPFIAVACTSAVSVDSGAAPGADPGARPAGTAVALEAAPAEAAADDWRDIELTDVTTGETFTLASLKGEVVAIEPMAVWCTNCTVQNKNVKLALPELEAAGIRFVSLGIEPNERPETLADYAEKRGFEWTFAQSPIELSRALNDIFGPQVLAVPSTPLIVLDQSGEVAFHDFGFHGPESLVKILSEVTG